MRVLGIHHVAFAHPEGAGAHDVLNDLFGLPVVHTERADGMVERMIDTGHGYLQTLEAGSGEGVINRYVERNGGRLHHVALEVEDIAGAVSELVDRGVEMVDKEPRRGGDGTMIAFIHPNATAGMLVELVEVA